MPRLAADGDFLRDGVEEGTMIRLEKQERGTSFWRPLEQGVITVRTAGAAGVTVSDAAGRVYVAARCSGSRKVRFAARGAAGAHAVRVLGKDGRALGALSFVLKPHTAIAATPGPYGKLEQRLRNIMTQLNEQRSHIVSGKFYQLLVCWLRDHTHVLKAQKYHIADVKSGVEFFLERQQPNGMIWDDVNKNPAPGHPSILGEALGKEYNAYEEGMKWILRRIPVEADVEYLLVEAVHYAWKASGDDQWMKAQLPKLEKAIRYTTSHPARWSAKHRLVKRAYTADTWDFVNPRFGVHDHRLLAPGMKMFLFHGDNSGCYAGLRRLAEMHAAAGNAARAAHWKREARSFRARANRKLWRDPIYAHMVPEQPIKGLKGLVGDDDERMSLSLGYTINRGLPSHRMATKILGEYQRRRKLHARSSFAEWWTMDPMYSGAQWPNSNRNAGCPEGEYMNGAITPIVAGELGRAAFEHGLEEYGADILRRVWELSERDGGDLQACYRRVGLDERETLANFTPVDIRALANVGLRNGAHCGVTAWTGEGDNDMRNLPFGRQVFGGVRFDVIDPATNNGCSVIALKGGDGAGVMPEALIPVPKVQGGSVHFLHATGHSSATAVGIYDIVYDDCSRERIYVRPGHEIGHWWGIQPLSRPNLRVAWQGPNPTFGNVGLYRYGWNNPHPEKAIAAVRLLAAPGKHVMVAGISISDRPVSHECGIHSYGIPETWAQAAVYYALAEGLAGIEDTGRAFSSARVAPRWAATEATAADVCLHYPASDGYCAYTYKRETAKRRVRLDVTGSFSAAAVHCLLPGSSKAKRVTIGGEEAPFRNVRIGKASYVDFEVKASDAGPAVIEY
ncbi:MAG: hypothetical protein NTW87_20920 [Planctomycetota bacterium]|nr:hypothetical protein [Planctomycetota bacterium]